MLGVRGATAGALTASPARRRLFASFLATLARSYPQVRSFVVGNEPNQPRFWQPQFRGRRPVAGAAYERVLALAYDALKRVRPSIQVVAAGISSRGNDDPVALENRSTSPVRFIRDLGAAYRTSGRTRPIMDALGFHPYPRSSTDSLRRPLDWPNASYANLGRVRQALWDAFHDTRQPTTENDLRIVIDEVGWQAAVPAAAQSAYTGFESVAVASERAQAGVYSELVRRSACDRTIAGVFLFPLLDEPDLERFQSGIVRADASRRPSFDAVRSAVAGTRRGCSGRSVSWRHARTVVGARVTFGTTAQGESRAPPVVGVQRQCRRGRARLGERRPGRRRRTVAGGGEPREPRGRPPRGRASSTLITGRSSASRDARFPPVPTRTWCSSVRR